MKSKAFIFLASALVCLSVSYSVKSQCSVERATPFFSRAVFGLTTNFLKELYQDGENLVFSPISLWTELATTAEGASGETYRELQKILDLKIHRCFNENYYKLVKSLTAETEKTKLHRNTILVADNTLRLESAFEKRINSENLANLLRLDLTNANDAAHHINQYVSKETQGEITDVVQPDNLEGARLVIIDTVNFKAAWKRPFNGKHTISDVFFNDDGQQVNSVEMMNIVGEFRKAELSMIKATALELPYAERYVMLIILPFSDNRLSEVVHTFRSVTVQGVMNALDNSYIDTVKVFLPKFKVESKVELTEALMNKLNVSHLYGPRADLSKMSLDPLEVSNLYHKASITVDEVGTAASAATVETIEARMLPDEFKANKPFLYMIVDEQTKTPVFVGAFTHPNN